MRVSENTSAGAVGGALKRSRGKLERLQIQNATQKNLITPSDDPASNSKIMDIRTQKTVNSQFAYNGNIAKNRLTNTDGALQEMYDLFVRAKEIAISQSSAASANADSRLGVAQEVSALYQQLVSVANRRLGQHYLFSGFKTMSPAYSNRGDYLGDNGEIPVEIQKDVYTSMNVTGPMAFEVRRYKPEEQGTASDAVDKIARGPSESKEDAPPIEKTNARPIETINAFHELDTLRVGLLTNDTIAIRDSMERIDEVIKNTITLRAKVSSRVAGINSALEATEKTDVTNAELATRLEDADYTDLWANLAKEETVMRSSLQAAQKLIQPTLLDFLK